MSARPGEVDPLLSLIRLPLRYFVAFALIPVGVLIGCCAMIQHAFRKLPHTQRRD